MKPVRLLLLALVTLLTTTAHAVGSPARDALEKISNNALSFFGMRETQNKNTCRLKIRHWQGGSTYRHPRFMETDANIDDTANSWQECYAKALVYSGKYVPAIGYDYTYRSGEKESVTYHSYAKWYWQEHEGAVTVYTPMSVGEPQVGDQRIFHKEVGDPPHLPNEYFRVVIEPETFLTPDQY